MELVPQAQDRYENGRTFDGVEAYINELGLQLVTDLTKLNETTQIFVIMHRSDGSEKGYIMKGTKKSAKKEKFPIRNKVIYRKPNPVF